MPCSISTAAISGLEKSLVREDRPIAETCGIVCVYVRGDEGVWEER